MRRPFCALIALSLGAGDALACANLNAKGKRIEAKRQARYLAEADRVVRGEWTFDKAQNYLDEGSACGTLVASRPKGRRALTETLCIRQEINCGFPNYPGYSKETNERFAGLFYLKKDEGSYGLIHFQSLEASR